MTGLALVFAVATAAEPAPAAAMRGAPIHVLIVANNQAVDSRLAPLRFADDDGARYFEVFSTISDDVTLLAVLDADTQRRYRTLAEQAAPPTLSKVQAQLAAVFERMRRESLAGLEPVFYFVYAGHGEVGENHEGHIFLPDKRWRRADLYDSVIARSTAAYNHVILDACQSYFMVSSRGAWKDDRVETVGGEVIGDHAIAAYMARESLDRYPNTGVILSTSSAKESHEWAAIEAGVFSHELRSGLLGAADVNGDGRVEYSEIKAFIAAANNGIDDPKARINVYARPPAARLSAPLFDLANARGVGFLRLDAAEHGRFSIEDERGVRYADFNKSAEQGLTIALIARGAYYLRHGQTEKRVSPRVGQLSAAVDGAWVPIALAARGAVAEALQHRLFAVGYGPSFYRGFVASTGDLPVAEVVHRADSGGARETSLRPWLWTGAGVTLGSGAALAASALLAKGYYDAFATQLAVQGTANADLLARQSAARVAANVLIGTTAIAGVTTLALFLLDRLRPSATLVSAGVAPAADGAHLSFEGRF